MPFGKALPLAGATESRISRCAISADSSQIAYLLRGEGDIDEIHLLQRATGNATRIYRNAANRRIVLGPWSSTSQWVMIAFVRADGWTIAMLSTSGAARELHTQPYFDGAAISPDGHWIATCRTCGEKQSNHCIFILSSETGEERLLWQNIWDSSAHMFFTKIPSHKAEGYNGSSDVVAWTPDGRSILFVGDRRGPRDLWRLPVRNGVVAGKPSLVAAAVGIVGNLGLTAGGSLYYVPVVNRPAGIAIVDIDPEIAALKGPPVLVPTGSPNRHEDPFWSPDSRKLIFYSFRSSGDGIYVVDTSSNRELRMNPKLQGYNYYSWLPDETVVTWGVDHKGRIGFYRVRMASRKTVFLAPLASDDSIGFPALTSDGKTLMYRSDRRNAIIRLILATGKEDEVYHASPQTSIWSVRLSPDDRHIAFLLTSGEREYRRNGPLNRYALCPLMAALIASCCIRTNPANFR